MGAALTRPSRTRLLRARDYLAVHFNERVSLAEAAAEAELSPFHFQRFFAAAFTETPHEFVTRLRIDHAKKLLLAGNHSVTDICFDSGYESLGSFSWRFHSLTGLSPAAFRRESRRVFGTSGRYWPLYYMPACFQHFFAGGIARSEK
jgi:AraC-like DNA-binding protein